MVRQEQALATLPSVLESLSSSSDRLRARLQELHGEAVAHAGSSLSGLQELRATREALMAERRDGGALLTTHQLAGELQALQRVLDSSGAVASDLLPAVSKLESVARRTYGVDASAAHCVLMTALVDAVRRNEVHPVSATAVRQLRSVIAAADAAVGRTWTAFLASGAETLFHSARALTLAPPGEGADGLGLDEERARLVEARALLNLADCVDQLLMLSRAPTGGGHTGGGGGGSAPPLAHRCSMQFRAACTARLSSALQVAIRLATHGANAPDEASVLDALAEATDKSAKAMRSLGSVFGLVPLQPPDAPAPTAAAGGAATEAAPAGTPHDAAVALSQELAESADGLLALLAMVPPTPEAGRPARLRAVATGISELLKRQLASAGVLVGAAESARGRRALAMLGEGGERLAAAVLAQSQRAAAL